MLLLFHFYLHVTHFLHLENISLEVKANYTDLCPLWWRDRTWWTCINICFWLFLLQKSKTTKWDNKSIKQHVTILPHPWVMQKQIKCLSHICAILQHQSQAKVTLSTPCCFPPRTIPDVPSTNKFYTFYAMLKWLLILAYREWIIWTLQLTSC